MAVGPDTTVNSQAKVYTKQGGTEQVIDVGGTQSMYGAANLNGVKVPAKATLTPAASTSNICLVTIQVNDNAGNPITVPTNLDVWLSDAASGAGLTATTASGAVTIGATGTLLGTLTSKKALRLQTDATGLAILSITDTAKTAFVVCAQVEGYAIPSVSAALVTGNYG